MMMKKIGAFIEHFQMEDVKKALDELGIGGMTASEVKGFGSQKDHRAAYAGNEYTVGFASKLKFEIVISDNRVQKAAAIVKAAQTGKIGDGKVFVLGIGRVHTDSNGRTLGNGNLRPRRKEPRTSAFYPVRRSTFPRQSKSSMSRGT